MRDKSAPSNDEANALSPTARFWFARHAPVVARSVRYDARPQESRCDWSIAVTS